MSANGQAGVAILVDLAILGVSIRLKGNNLCVKPRSKITERMTHRLECHKAEVLEALRGSAPVLGRCARFAAAQNELLKRGFHVLADKPELVLAILAVAEAVASEFGDAQTEEKSRDDPPVHSHRDQDSNA